jgi:pimeloyl-ACP methyl ester carboxylesterase
MKLALWTMLLVLLIAMVTGCGSTGTSRFVNLSNGQGYDRGLVVCLSGAGGMTGEVDRIRLGLTEGGASCAIESFEWSTGMVLVDQADFDSNRAKARALARHIEAYRAEYRDRPVHLIGVSAGTGLAVWAVEDLSAGCPIDNIILIGSSLSQNYDLAAALRNIRGHLVNHYSPADMVLSLGVTLAGTVDRGGGISGGLHGFVAPDRAGEETLGLYDYRLLQIGWKAEDATLGHLGDHLGGTQPAFVKERIAPLTWSRQDVISVADAGRN